MENLREKNYHRAQTLRLLSTNAKERRVINYITAALIQRGGDCRKRWTHLHAAMHKTMPTIVGGTDRSSRRWLATLLRLGVIRSARETTGAVRRTWVVAIDSELEPLGGGRNRVRVRGSGTTGRAYVEDFSCGKDYAQANCHSCREKRKSSNGKAIPDKLNRLAWVLVMRSAERWGGQAYLNGKLRIRWSSLRVWVGRKLADGHPQERIASELDEAIRVSLGYAGDYRRRWSIGGALASAAKRLAASKANPRTHRNRRACIARPDSLRTGGLASPQHRKPNPDAIAPRADAMWTKPLQCREIRNLAQWSIRLGLAEGWNHAIAGLRKALLEGSESWTDSGLYQLGRYLMDAIGVVHRTDPSASEFRRFAECLGADSGR